jgi:hypothetical protein
MATPTRIASVALALSALLLAGCSSSDRVDHGTSVATAASPSPSSSATRQAVGFDQTYRSSDGVVAGVAEIKNAKLEPFPMTEDPNAKEGDPYVLLITSTTNKTKATVMLVPGAVLTYGAEGTRAAEVNVGEELDGAVPLHPGESYDYAFGFIVPNESRHQVVMEFTMTIDPLRTAIFSGSITPV